AGEVRGLTGITTLSRLAANAHVLAREPAGDATFVLDVRDGSQQPLAIARPHPIDSSLSGTGAVAVCLYDDRTLAVHDVVHHTHRELGPFADLVTDGDAHVML